MGITTRSLISTNLPNNSTRSITPLALRNTLNGVVDYIDTKIGSQNPTFTGTVSGITPAMVGLGNVSNTSDANKPVSIAQAAINASKLQTVTSIAELQAYTSSNFAYFDGSTWERKSGNVVSNGGEFAGTILNISTGFYWERKLISGIVTPEMFGAVGNGIANDAALIQNAINSGNEILLNKTYFLNNNTLTLNANTVINFNHTGNITGGIIVGNESKLLNVKNLSSELRGTFAGSCNLSWFNHTDSLVNFYNGIRFDEFIIDKDFYVDVPISHSYNYRNKLKKSIRIIGKNNAVLSYKGVGNNGGIGYSNSVITFYTGDFFDKSKIDIFIKDLRLFSTTDDSLFKSADWGVNDINGWWNSHGFIGGNPSDSMFVNFSSENLKTDCIGQIVGFNSYQSSYVSYTFLNTDLKTAVWPCFGVYVADASTTFAGTYRGLKSVVANGSYLYGCTLVGGKNNTQTYNNCYLENWFECTNLDGYTFNITADNCRVKGGFDNTNGANESNLTLGKCNGYVEVKNSFLDKTVSFRRLMSLSFNNCTGYLDAFTNGSNFDLYRINDVNFKNCNISYTNFCNFFYCYNSLIIDNSSILSTVNKHTFGNQINIVSLNKIHINSSEILGYISDVTEMKSSGSSTSLKLVYFQKDNSFEYFVDNSLGNNDYFDLALYDKDATSTLSIQNGMLFSGDVTKTFTLPNKYISSLFLSFEQVCNSAKNAKVGMYVELTDINNVVYKFGMYTGSAAWLYDGTTLYQENVNMLNHGTGTYKVTVTYSDGKVFANIGNRPLSFYQFGQTANLINNAIQIKNISVKLENYSNNLTVALTNPKILFF